MVQYVTADAFRKWAYIEDGIDEDKIDAILMSAQKTVDREIAKFKGNTLEKLADDDGQLPFDAIEAILIRATQSYSMPDGMRPSSIGLDSHYWEIIHNLSEA